VLVYAWSELVFTGKYLISACKENVFLKHSFVKYSQKLVKLYRCCK
jgi:hypothetical protein